MTELTVLFASSPDEEDLVGEIWKGDDYVLDVRRRPTGLRAFVHPLGPEIDVDLHDLAQALSDIRERLQP